MKKFILKPEGNWSLVLTNVGAFLSGAVATHLAKPGAKAVEVIIQEHQEKRRLIQNGLYWSICTEAAAIQSERTGRHHTKDDFDMLFRKLHLGTESSSVVVAGEEIVTTALQSHRALGVHDFAEYVNECLATLSDYDIVVSDPTVKEWREAA